MRSLAIALALLFAAATVGAMNLPEETGHELSNCGDNCSTDSDCVGECQYCFLGSCFYFPKESTGEERIGLHANMTAAERERGYSCISFHCVDRFCPTGCYCDWDHVCKNYMAEEDPDVAADEAPEEKCVATGQNCPDCDCDCCSGLCACDDDFGCTCEEFKEEAPEEKCISTGQSCPDCDCDCCSGLCA